MSNLRLAILHNLFFETFLLLFYHLPCEVLASDVIYSEERRRLLDGSIRELLVSYVHAAECCEIINIVTVSIVSQNRKLVCGINEQVLAKHLVPAVRMRLALFIQNYSAKQ